MTQEEIKGRVLDVWNNGNVDALGELWDDNFVRHEVGVRDDVVGLEAFKDLIISMRATYPDFNLEFEEIFVKDDMHASRWVVTGTNTGPGDIPPTGKAITVHGASLSIEKDGKFVEEWVYYNLAAGLTQLGYTITPPSVEEE